MAGECRAEEESKRVAFLEPEGSRGRVRRQRHRRHVGQKSRPRASGEIRPAIVYIEIRSCRNAGKCTDRVRVAGESVSKRRTSPKTLTFDLLWDEEGNRP